jgi:hypothetical protein
MDIQQIIEQIHKYVHGHEKSINPKGHLHGASHTALLEHLQSLDKEVGIDKLNIALDKMDALGQIHHRTDHLIEFNFN